MPGITCVPMERGVGSRQRWRGAGRYNQTLPVACATAVKSRNNYEERF